jgi:hypothetical protein
MSDERLIGTCGIVCSECGAYLATKNHDEPLRKKTAEEWSRTYSVEIRPESVHCVGCVAQEGRHFSHCAECNIRACGRKKGVANCGCCADYPCSAITAFFTMVPPAKAVLDAERVGN